jgi:hypothetical protein
LAFAKLLAFVEHCLEAEDDEAFDEFWTNAGNPEELDELLDQMSTDAFDMWFLFDRPLEDGRLVVDRFLEEDLSVTEGERRFLELARETCMRLYEVADVRPGTSISLRDVFDEAVVTVHEEEGSRHLGRADLLAARVISCGVSGKPEMEAGPLPISSLLRRSVVSQLSAHRAAFERENRGAGALAFYKEMPPFFHAAWVSAILDPPIPLLVNTDGEETLITRARFHVRDRERLLRGLDANRELERDETETVWRWFGPNREGKTVELGRIELEGEALSLETNSAPRAERGRALIETLAGEAVVHRGTSHEGLRQALRETVRSGQSQAIRQEDSASGIPAEVQEQLVLDFYARHYRQWLDDQIPDLDDRTPREAAKDPTGKAKVRKLIRGLEGLYQTALKENSPAYDPSWMWAELGLQDESHPAHPPPLAHERWAEAIPGWREVCDTVVARMRALPDFTKAPPLVSREDLEGDLTARRFLRDRREHGSSGHGRLPGLKKRGEEARVQQLLCAINYDLHGRKTFWVDESLVYMLAQTDLDVVGSEVRAPFPSFALVFTDRLVLSLAERLIAGDRKCPLAGHILRAATTYVTEESTAPEDRVLKIGFALDALGADPPHFLRHDVRLQDGAPVGVHPGPPPPRLIVDGETLPAPARPLPGLLQVVLNAILYATSAGVEPQVRTAPRPSVKRDAGENRLFSSDEVFFLPGKIRISKLRQMQELERVPSGRKLLHRFMVRGHWRRAAKHWKEQRLRWIKPHWKGPDMAAVIERAYKLTP